MATYPSYNILLPSTMQEESGIADDFTPSGSQHSRILHSQSYFRFRLVHQLTKAQFDALKTFYDGGKRDEHTLTYHDESPAVTYTVKFTGPPVKTANLGADQFFVEVPLRGTKN